ncbi:hypothetical protein [Exiguobacterium sp. s5]|uniref:hypothetical protein n=1 Tax=Exiguobacterium sp. s5 TaxID=2751239 RepID=UPI001BEAEC99|nr:hypothetical protein [Exiguobacterium sp. s5]
MIKAQRYISMQNVEDIKANGGDFYKTYYQDAYTNANAWKIDSNFVLSAKASAAYNGYLRIFVGYLNVGDVIELSGEFAKVTGEISVGLERSDNANMSGFNLEESFASLNADTYLSRRNVKLNIDRSGFYRVAVGPYINGPSEFKSRNVSVLAHSTKMVKPWEGLETGIRKAVIRKESGVFVKRSDFAGDACTIAETTSDTLTVTFATAFPVGSLRPCYLVSGDYLTSQNNYMVKVDNASGVSATVRFYPLNPVSNTPVALASLPNNVQFSLQLSI